MSTHSAVFTVAPGSPFELRQVPTATPGPGQVLLHVKYTGSTPLDLHVADGWLLTTEPGVTGGTYAGDVVAVHESVTSLKVGDVVFGYTFAGLGQGAHQDYAAVPAWMCSKLPANLTMQEAVTVPTNLSTIFQAAHANLGLELPWPKPEGFVPQHADAPILIWGGSGSVGQYAIQVFRHWGYRRILATASARHHPLLKSLGATEVFDYREAGVRDKILAAAGGRVPFIFDCIGHLTGTVEPISKIAQKGDQVAIVLPVVLKDATPTERPEYEMDTAKTGTWAEGVNVTGIRAHHYPDNAMFKEKLQPEILPTLMEQGIVKPNPVRIVEGKTLLQRADNALDILRRKDQSGEKLVWKVSDL